MAIREIPKSFEYHCDRCPETHVQENASGHYSNSTPPKWLSLTIATYNKAPHTILLCDKCKTIFEELHVLPEGVL